MLPYCSVKRINLEPPTDVIDHSEDILLIWKIQVCWMNRLKSRTQNWLLFRHFQLFIKFYNKSKPTERIQISYLCINPTLLAQVRCGTRSILKRLVWLGWVLWHINHCRSFNAKSYLSICIKYIYIWFVNTSCR